jgi:nucleoside permease NupC
MKTVRLLRQVFTMVTVQMMIFWVVASTLKTQTARFSETSSEVIFASHSGLHFVFDFNYCSTFFDSRKPSQSVPSLDI